MGRKSSKRHSTSWSSFNLNLTIQSDPADHDNNSMEDCMGLIHWCISNGKYSDSPYMNPRLPFSLLGSGLRRDESDPHSAPQLSHCRHRPHRLASLCSLEDATGVSQAFFLARRGDELEECSDISPASFLVPQDAKPDSSMDLQGPSSGLQIDDQMS